MVLMLPNMQKKIISNLKKQSKITIKSFPSLRKNAYTSIQIQPALNLKPFCLNITSSSAILLLNMCTVCIYFKVDHLSLYRENKTKLEEIHSEVIYPVVKFLARQ